MRGFHRSCLNELEITGWTMPLSTSRSSHAVGWSGCFAMASMAVWHPAVLCALAKQHNSRSFSRATPSNAGLHSVPARRSSKDLRAAACPFRTGPWASMASAVTGAVPLDIASTTLDQRYHVETQLYAILATKSAIP